MAIERFANFNDEMTEGWNVLEWRRNGLNGVVGP